MSKNEKNSLKKKNFDAWLMSINVNNNIAPHDIQ